MYSFDLIGFIQRGFYMNVSFLFFSEAQDQVFQCARVSYRDSRKFNCWFIEGINNWL